MFKSPLACSSSLAKRGCRTITTLEILLIMTLETLIKATSYWWDQYVRYLRVWVLFPHLVWGTTLRSVSFIHWKLQDVLFSVILSGVSSVFHLRNNRIRYALRKGYPRKEEASQCCLKYITVCHRDLHRPLNVSLCGSAWVTWAYKSLFSSVYTASFTTYELVFL